MALAELSRTGLANRYPQLEYGVRIVERVVEHSIFQDLGYTVRQHSIAERVFQGLRDGRFDTRLSPSLMATHVGSQRGDTVNVAMLRSGGYAVEGNYKFESWVPKPNKDRSNFTEIMTSVVTVPAELAALPPFPDTPSVIARLRIIPAMLADMTPELLARFLYEGSESTGQKIGLVQEDRVTKGLSSIFTAMAVYSAEYLDSKDGRDLLVFTDFTDKDYRIEDPKVRVEHWRRVARVEVDQQAWVVFASPSVDFRFPEI